MARARGSAVRRLVCFIGIFVLLMGWLPAPPVAAANPSVIICVTPQGENPPAETGTACNMSNTFHDTFQALTQASFGTFGTQTDTAYVLFFADPAATNANPTIYTSNRGTEMHPGTNVPTTIDIIAVGPVTLQTTSPDESLLKLDPGFQNILIDGFTLTGGKAPIFGGALTNLGSATVTIENCAITGNSLFFSGSENAGALYNPAGATMNVINTTITNNSGALGGSGAIFNKGNLNVIYSTIVGNTGTSAGGGGIFNNGGTETLTNSIVAGNTGGAGDIGGAPAPTNHNSDIGNATGLGTLGDNGGTVRTIPILSGFEANFAAPGGVIGPSGAPIVTDARNALRPSAGSTSVGPQGGTDTMGAYQANAIPPAQILKYAYVTDLMLTAGVPVNKQAAFTGGQPVYTYHYLTDLPPGMQFNPDGSFTGTPTTPGDYVLTVVGFDKGNNDWWAVTVHITVNPATGITISPPTLPNGKVGTQYSQTITASGGVGSFTFSVPPNTLPPGLTLDPNTGVLSGTPTTFGSYTFTITATDTQKNQGSQQYTVVIAPNIVLSPDTLPEGTQGLSYNQTITPSGGAGRYTFSISGNVPPGLTVDQPLLPSTGTAIHGTPTTPGTYTFTVIATDANGKSGSQQYTLVINRLLLVSCGGSGNTVNLKVGQQMQCMAIDPNGPHDVTNQVIWSASNGDVQVDQHGTATGEAPGPATITATLLEVAGVTTQNAVGKVTVTVLPLTPIGIVPAPAPANRPAGTTGQPGGAPAPAPNPAPTGR